MTEDNEFFSAQEVDRQIERLMQHKEGDQLDAEAMAYLRSYYQADATFEQAALDRIWNRIKETTLFEQTMPANEKELPMHNFLQHAQIPYGADRSHASHSRHSSLMRRLGTLVATVLLLAIVASLALVFYALRPNHGGTGSPHTPPVISSPARVPLAVTSVTMSVTPGSIAGLSCGTPVTVTYTALLHVKPNSAGGTVRFTYTVNNGRSQTPASITFSPGQTVGSYSFTWSGALPVDHTSPGLGGVQVTSPNPLTSSLVKPTGQCTSAAFQVTKIDMAVTPASIQGLACGTAIVVTYTATIHVAPGGPGGTVQFMYTVNNGRGQTPASITFSPGQTLRTYSFTWSGALPADHTAPGLGGIQVTSPDQLTSLLVKPAGMCR